MEGRPAFQPGLFAAARPSFDVAFTSLPRVQLDETSWVDVAPGFVSGGETL